MDGYNRMCDSSEIEAVCVWWRSVTQPPFKPSRRIESVLVCRNRENVSPDRDWTRNAASPKSPVKLAAAWYMYMFNF